MIAARGRRVAVALAGVVAVALLTGCGETGAAGDGKVTVSGTAPATTAPPTVPAAAVEAIVARNTKAFVRAARTFRACDKKVASDSYVNSPCLKQANALTASVDAFLGDLRSITLPPGEYDTLVTDLDEMSRAGAKVANKCAEANDQVCDQALARLRADEQSVLWDLDASL